MCDCDAPSAFCQRTRTARKEHRCCECHAIIAKGESYEYSSGIWDGSASDYKTCALCVIARKEYVDALPPHYCWPCFGELYEDWPEEHLPPHVAALRNAA